MPDASARTPATTASGRRLHRTLLVLTFLGLGLRLAMLPLGSRYGYFGDHDDFARWGLQAANGGFLGIYGTPPPRVKAEVWNGNAWTQTQREFDRVCNYPPGAVYLLWASGQVFNAVTHEPLINTLLSRTLFASWSVLADVLVAAGCFAIVRTLRSEKWAVRAYAVALLAPPMWWDSAVWGQVDATLIAPVVWMLWAMLNKRWLAAGVLYGVAAMLKPQAILFVPVWGWAVCFERPIRKVLTGGVAALITALVISLPFTLHSGSAWFTSSYVDNLLHAYPATTLKAFNIWYVDLLVRSADSTADCIAGLSRDAWGKVMLVALLGIGFFVLARRRQRPAALIWWALWVLVAAVMLPTRVHERYLLVALPFLIAAASLQARLWPAAALLMVVATAQVTWPLWLHSDPGGWPKFVAAEAPQYQAWLDRLPPDQRARAMPFEQAIVPARKQFLELRKSTVMFEWGLTAAALVATAWILVCMPPTPEACRQEPGNHRRAAQR